MEINNIIIVVKKALHLIWLIIFDAIKQPNNSISFKKKSV